MRLMLAGLIICVGSTFSFAGHRLVDLSCEYRDAVCAMHDQLAADPYASQYVVMYSDRLHHAADHLHDMVLRDPNCPQVFAAFDNVQSLHSRLAGIAARRCSTGQRFAVVFRPVDRSMVHLTSAINYAHRYPVSAPVVRRRIEIQYPNYSTRRVPIAAPAPIVSPAPIRQTYPPAYRSPYPTGYLQPQYPATLDTRSVVPSPRYRLDRQRQEFQRQDYRQLNTAGSLARVIAGLLD